MALCGIKEYDKLPGRVGIIDVDYLKYRLKVNIEEKKKLEFKLTCALNTVNNKNNEVKKQ